MELLLTELQNCYVVDCSTCRQETEAFVREAIKRGMLQERQTA